MNLKFKSIICVAALAIATTICAAATTLKMPTNFGVEPDRNATTYNAVKDYGVMSGVDADQTPKLQKALDEISAKGGGNLVIPRGEYRFAELYMRSNVNILVSSKAVLKPYYTPKTFNIIMLHFTPSKKELREEYIENCTISCLDKGKQYTVDYSEINSDGSKGLHQVRFIANRLVRNFMVADANIIDNYTKYCGIIFVGASTQDVADKWEITRPTNGVVRNCSITHASHGYGLCQLHAANDIFFEDLRANGGVTLRLEGHAGQNVGTCGIFGHNLYNECGKATVMFQPHVTHHGAVTIDGVEAVGSSFAVLIRAGFIDRVAKREGGTEVGSFEPGSRIDNIHAVYGRTGQTEAKDAWIYEPSELQYVKKVTKAGGCTQVEGPSQAVILDDTRGGYFVECTNVSFEGFPASHPADGRVLTGDLPRSQKQTWTISKSVKAFDK